MPPWTRTVRRREVQLLLPAHFSQPVSATSLRCSERESEAVRPPRVSFGDVQEGTSAVHLHVRRTGGNTPPRELAFGQREGSCWGRRSMLEIPEQRVLASAQPGVRLWEENHPCKSTRVRAAVLSPDTVEPRGYSQGFFPSFGTVSP